MRHFGRINYEAYCEAMGVTPNWAGLTNAERRAWRKAAHKVRKEHCQQTVTALDDGPAPEEDPGGGDP